MTDSQIQAIRAGDQFIDREGVRWIAKADARLEQPATSNATHQAWLASASGAQSLRLTFRNASQFSPIVLRLPR